MHNKLPTKILCLVLLLFSLAIQSGCAVSSAAIMDEEQVFNTKPIAHYKGLKIEDFRLKRELVTSSDDSSISQREKRYLSMPSEIAAKTEPLVSARHIFPIVSRTMEASKEMLILAGEFTRISRFKVALNGHILEGGSSGKEIAKFKLTLWDIYDTSKVIELISKETADFIDRIQYK